MNPENNPTAAGTKSRINHSVCKWCYDDIPLDELCVIAKDIGIQSIDLLMPEDFPTLHRHGLTCAMVSFPTGKTPDGITVGLIEKAFNRIEHHDTLVEIYEPHLRASAAAGAKQVICFSGNRDGMDDAQGLENCAIGLRRLLPLAGELGLQLVMELLNSKVDHPDYMCDHTDWGVKLCERLGHDNFSLLYDIYHMQIMEGNVMQTIREKHRWFSHYHTGGVPGRNEIDDSQELNYAPIMRAIADTGYNGFVAQEFMPKRPDKLASLKQGVGICDI